MPDTPLNPDALEAARFALTRSERAFDRGGKPADPLHIATAIVSAYLAVARPEVNSVEELDALPIGSAIIDKHGDVGLIDRDGTIEKCVQFAETIAMSIGYTAKHFLPARVLYRPEVNDA